MKQAQEGSTGQIAYDQSLLINEFQISKSEQHFEVNKIRATDNSHKKVFSELPLQEQENIVKKSFEMVSQYKPHLSILFRHYSKFPLENEFVRNETFQQNLSKEQYMIMNRYMIFCKEFSIIKSLEFKKKNQKNPSLSKSLLMNIFKKSSIKNRYMTVDSFMMSLVTIAIKMYETFDIRSFLHMEMLLNSLNLKIYDEFVNKLKKLNISYTSSEMIKCFPNIFKKIAKKPSNQINNHSSLPKLTDIKLSKDIQMQSFQSVQSQSNKSSLQSNFSSMQKDKKNSRLKDALSRRPSLPALPPASQNKFFKPIEHNHHLNNYKTYLKASQDSSSVLKNKITGYSTISKLRNSIVVAYNPQQVSKQQFNKFLEEARSKYGSPDQQIQFDQPQTNEVKVGNQLQRKMENQQEKPTPASSAKQTLEMGIQSELQNVQSAKPMHESTLCQTESLPNTVHQINQQKSDKFIHAKLQGIDIIPATSIIPKKHDLRKPKPENKKQREEENSQIYALQKQIDFQEEDEILDTLLRNENEKEKLLNHKMIETFKKMQIQPPSNAQEQHTIIENHGQQNQA